MKENLLNKGIITEDMMEHFFLEPSATAMGAHINSEVVSLIIIFISLCIGIFAIYQTTKNLRILRKHYVQASKKEFDTENNKTLKTAQMDEALNGNKRIPFRKWITEPPSLTTLANIQLKRKYKAVLNTLILFLGIFLVLAPIKPFFTLTPYAIEVNDKVVVFKNLFSKNTIIYRQDMQMIKYQKQLDKDGAEYFYPRCKITFLSKNGYYEFVVKNYNMENLRLKECI